MSTASIPRVKPLLRGVSHEVAAGAAAAAAIALVVAADGGRAALASAVYGLALTTMFTVSALYHRVTWRPPARARMRRIDHAAIFVLIAGTYTPLCVVGIGGAAGSTLLSLVWAGAAAGVLQATVFFRAPRAVAVTLYVALGWIAVAYLGEVREAAGPIVLALLAAGGVLYTVGAVIYALRRPDPVPTVFGYHEIFHALVVAASVCHFVAVALVVRG
jgi:hemolysin III